MESAIVVAFAGRIGSGKTTVTSSLAKLLEWHRASFGDYVRLIARERGVRATREELQRIGTEMLHEDPWHFCNSVLLNCGWKRGDNLIIDGLRHAETIGIIRELVEPAPLKIVLLRLDDVTRTERVMLREGSDATSTTLADTHSSEQQVNSTLATFADLVVDARKPVQVIVSEVTSWIRGQQTEREAL